MSWYIRTKPKRNRIVCIFYGSYSTHHDSTGMHCMWDIVGLMRKRLPIELQQPLINTLTFFYPRGTQSVCNQAMRKPPLLGEIIDNIMAGYSKLRSYHPIHCLCGIALKNHASSSRLLCPNPGGNGVIVTSLLRQNDVATSFRRNNDVTIASCARWEHILRY